MKDTITLLVLVGILKAGESAITAWTKPDIATAEGSGSLTEKINHGVTTGGITGITITATADNVVTYAKESQVQTSPVLAIDPSTGVVTVTSGIVDYTSDTSLTLVVTATDDSGSSFSTATVTINVNAAPSFSSHSSTPCIIDGATEGTDLIDLSATDANSGTTITYAIASGNTNTDFTITSTGVVEVASAKTLDIATTNSYTLVITAADDSSTKLTATTTVTATVSSTCPSDSGAAALAVTFMTVLVALIISLL